MFTTLATLVGCGPPGGVGSNKDEASPTVVDLVGTGVAEPDEDREEEGLAEVGARVTGDATCNNSFGDGS